jgi:hypothetical protein
LIDIGVYHIHYNKPLCFGSFSFLAEKPIPIRIYLLLNALSTQFIQVHNKAGTLFFFVIKQLKNYFFQIHEKVQQVRSPNFKEGGPIEASYRKNFLTNVKTVRSDEKNTVFKEKSKKNFLGVFLAIFRFFLPLYSKFQSIKFCCKEGQKRLKSLKAQPERVKCIQLNWVKH